jgi:hypothetical protein
MTGRHRSTFRTIERDVYLADRTSLDIRAAARGPVPLAKRLIRRKATRTGFSLLRGLLR